MRAIRIREAASAVAVVAGVALCAPASAGAAFTLPSLLSGTATLQFEEANAPAMASGGGYVAFRGTLAGRPGVYRRSLASGEVALVAEGDATAPSISESGQYVAFTTTADLEPEYTPAGQSEPVGEPAVDRGCPEVYVRNMQLVPGEPGAYTLAAALGAGRGIEFTGGCTSLSSGFAIAGAQAAPGVALSADGQRVVFTVLSASNLAGAGTQASQVVVRDLKERTTTLVSVTPAGVAVPGGGAFPSTATLTESKLPSERVQLELPQQQWGDEATASTAAIDADGNAVAWLGTNVAAQVSAAEAARAPALAAQPSGREGEPLWRPVYEPEAHTRRLLAGTSLQFFYKRASEVEDPLTAGSLVGTHSADFIAPALSANGEKVALVATAPSSELVASLEERLNIPITALNTDAYVVRVNAEPASAPVVTPLTEIPSYSFPEADTEDVKDIAISADGERVAFDTARTQLDLPSLSLVSPFVPYAKTAYTYEANLQAGTLQRVGEAYDGLQPNGEDGLLSFAGGDQTLAFASRATNLFYGDGISAWEVYDTTEQPVSAQVVEEQIGPVPPPLAASVAPEWVLGATATAAPDGDVVLDAEVPGAGRLTVDAIAQLPAQTKASGDHAKVSARRRRERRRAQTAGARLLARTVAAGAQTAAAASEIVLRLQPDAQYRDLVSGGDGLYAILRVTFAAAGHATLTREIPVVLRDTQTKRPAAAARAKGRGSATARAGAKGTSKGSGKRGARG